ncbi:MAG: VOC family protein [Chloroflexi bacterium]|nr:VOC family protein [Chloroflexota bacterium]
MSQSVPVGTILWQDLTLPEAEPIRDFYRQVIGWEVRGEDMGGYEDYHMLLPGTDESVTGICHARESNADLAQLPPVWLMYIVVADVAKSAAACQALGGKRLTEPRPMGAGLFCVIQDPAGAICALYQLEVAQPETRE